MAKPRLLIVDDEAPTRDALLRYLRSRFEVTGAADGAEAIEFLSKEDFDLVLTDLRMPHADGMSVLEAVRGKTPRPMCILLTAYGSISDAVSAVKAGAFDFVPKPIKLEKLDEVIQAALAAKSQSSASAAVENTQPLQSAPSGVSGEEEGVFPHSPDSPMGKVLELADTVAPSRSTVLITGESGTGKEVIARRLHDKSGRKGLFVAVHCAALNANLLESELFGHERGAFTGADTRRRGRFEIADGGTVFLDEIGEIDAATQVKLLRVIESRTFERVGGTELIHTDARLVAATNRDLRKMVADGSFREDLFYRLSVINLHLPPLRERKEEIPVLIQHFLQKFAKENQREITGISPEAMKRLTAYSWPGNIRELRNAIEFMVVTSPGPEPGVEQLPESFRMAEPLPLSPKKAPSLSLESNEFQLIREALERCKGNRTEAAKLLGISRRTLQRKIAEMDEEKL